MEPARKCVKEPACTRKKFLQCRRIKVEICTWWEWISVKTTREPSLIYSRGGSDNASVYRYSFIQQQTIDLQSGAIEMNVWKIYSVVLVLSLVLASVAAGPFIFYRPTQRQKPRHGKEQSGYDRWRDICRVHAADSVGFPGRIPSPVCP